MVYCGKPSKACLECRIKRRKTKCDLSKPSCGQCVRARSTCSGYRDQVALAFRDQSMDVVRRARPSDNQPKRSIPSNISNAFSAGKEPSLQPLATNDVESYLNCVIFPVVTIPVENQAASFFFHHYISSNTYFSTSHNDCLAMICARPSAHVYLFSIIEAIGIASLSNLTKDPNLMCVASRKYSVALEKLRVGLTEPAEVISDQILIGVLLFTLYETVASTAARKTTSKTSHLDGALTLLQLRGLDQLNTKNGRYLFYQLRTEVLINCLEKITPIPQVMRKWMSEAQKFEIGDSVPFSCLANIIANICAFRATTMSFYNVECIDKPDLDLHVSEALSIDADLAKWSANLPLIYKYSATRRPVGREDLFLGICHNYSGLWIAHTWNFFRCARILLNQTLTRLISLNIQLMPSVPETSSYRSLLDASYNIIQECSVSILLSAPFILGDFRKEQDTSSTLQAACGVSLLWPLYIAGTACPAPKLLRDRAILHLEKIGDTAGVQKATIIAMMLRRVGDLEHNKEQNEVSNTTSLSIQNETL